MPARRYLRRDARARAAAAPASTGCGRRGAAGGGQRLGTSGGGEQRPGKGGGGGVRDGWGKRKCGRRDALRVFKGLTPQIRALLLPV